MRYRSSDDDNDDVVVVVDDYDDGYLCTATYGHG